MPVRDASGKRLSGAAQRKRKEAQTAALLAPSREPRGERIAVREVRPNGDADPGNPFVAAPPPPYDGGPTAVEAWAAHLGAEVLRAAEDGTDPMRVRWVSRALRKLGQLKDKSRHSYKVVQLIWQFQRVKIDLLGDAPPDEPMAIVCWAFFRLARAIHSAATAPGEWDLEEEVRWSLVTDSAASIGYLPQVQAIKSKISELAAGKAKAMPAATTTPARPTARA